MKIRFVVFLLLMLIGMSGCVEPEIEVFGSISGIVKDSQSNSVIEGAKVTLSPGGLSQITGEDGTFSFEELDQAEYTLSFVKEGYEDESQKVSVKPGASASVQVSMMPIVPELALSTTVLDFEDEISTLSIDISNKGKGELKWTLTEDIEWFEASESEGSVTTDVASIVFKVSRGSLEEGVHIDSFVISSNAGSQTVTVMLTVSTLQIGIVPTYLDFSTMQNQLELRLANLGKKNLTWKATVTKDWITLSKDNGILSKEDVISVVVTREGLSAGRYSADILFVSDGGEFDVPVHMDVAVDEKPTVTTESYSNVTYNSARLHGSMMSVGSSKVVRYGFCWSEDEDPTLDDEFSNLGDCNAPEGFETQLSNLLPEKLYYFRAYAENSVGVSYADKVLSFVTAGMPTAPTVSTGVVEEITSFSARVKGTIVSLGNVSEITRYGHVWSESAEPTIENGLFTDLGTKESADSFVSELTELESATNYYVRAYAENEKGISYGTDVTFVTLKSDVKLTTEEPKDIIHDEATCGGTILETGGHKIVEKGVCYGKETHPTLDDSFMTSESSADTYSCRLKGLEMETVYYVRAYVKTAEDIVFYGSDKKFSTTKEVKAPELGEMSVSDVTVSSARCACEILSDGNSPITSCGFCWSENESPTIEENVVNCDITSADMGVTLSDLEDGKTFYVRAFAVNAKDVSYSNQTMFTTIPVTVPVVSNVAITDLTVSSAYLTSSVQEDGNSTITDCGFVYSDTVMEPTINDMKISCGKSIGEIAYKLENLPDGTMFYVRAYAENAKGVGYGEVNSFTTVKVTTPELDAVSVVNIGKTTANVSSALLFDGYSEVTDYGFCWSTSSSPTVNDNKVSAFPNDPEAEMPASGMIAFKSKLTELPELTTIYVRSYAVNEKGVGYGLESSFTTIEVDTDVWDGKEVATRFSDGKGTMSFPVIINTAAELALFAKNVSEGTVYSGIYFKLGSNISLDGHPWEFSAGKFEGHLDGNGRSILGYNSAHALFASTSGTIKNLNMSGVIESADKYVGAISSVNSGGINNCNVDVKITSDRTDSDGGTGGIVGLNTGHISSCSVSGVITSNDSNTGGITGMNNSTISHCVSKVSINSTAGVCGGISGYLSSGGVISDSSNSGSVTGSDNIGGIVGNNFISTTSAFNICNIYNCENSGNITAVNSSAYAGGIVGWLNCDVSNSGYNSNIRILNCLNTGSISSTYAGGICGYIDLYGYGSSVIHPNLSNCVNCASKGLVGTYKSDGSNTIDTGYWLFEIVSNIGQESGVGSYSETRRWFNRDALGCYVKGEEDLLTKLNAFVDDNQSESIVLKKWKYEIIDGYACPVFDE